MSAETIVTIRNARLSYPNLFEKSGPPGSKPTYNCALLLDPAEHAEVIAKIEKIQATLIKESCRGKQPKEEKNKGIQDGDHASMSDKDGYPGTMVLKPKSRKSRPVLLKQDASELSDMDDDPFYGGCYVNARIEFWGSVGGFGTTVGSNLITVQFARHGEAFGDGATVTKEEAQEGFEAVDPADDPF